MSYWNYELARFSVGMAILGLLFVGFTVANLVRWIAIMVADRSRRRTERLFEDWDKNPP